MEKLLSSIGWLVGKCSHQVLENMARLLAWFCFSVVRLRRKRILSNLLIAFPEMPEAERVRVGYESVYHFAATIIEFFYGYSNDITKHVSIEGKSIMEEALEKKQGVYVLCFHLGNWEAMGASFTRSICPAHVLVKKVGKADGGVNNFVEKQREKSGFLAVKRVKKGDGFQAIKRILANGEIVGFVMDQARPGEPRLPFFGKDAKTNTSLAAIWQRIPAPILPSYIVREKINHHVIKIFPEVELETSEDKKQDILAHSALFNHVIETHVRLYPEQYFWMHNRWK